MGLFSYRKNAMMAVDISATGIKLLELSRAHGKYTLQSMAMTPLPRDAIVENAIMDSGAVIQALTDAVDIARPATRNVAFAVSGNAVIIRTVTMPAMTELELESQIDYEAEQYIPHSTDDVYLDFQILAGGSDDDAQMDVVLAACKREVIDDYLRVLEEAGLEPGCVDCAVFALQNTAELVAGGTGHVVPDALADPAETRTHALVNIGANLININILQNGKMAFVRDQFYGGNNLTEAIQKAHGLSYQAAEQMKQDNFQGIGEEALKDFYTGLTSELVRSLDFYTASHADFPVQKLFLGGGTALLPGIAGELEQRLNIETRVLNPFSVITASGRAFNPDYLSGIGPRMVIPVGLALRSFNP